MQPTQTSEPESPHGDSMREHGACSVPSFARLSELPAPIHERLRRAARLRIELTETDHALDLVRFLRARGCIAYTIERSPAVEALRPLAAAAQEQAEIRELVNTWLADHPTATVQHAG